MTPLGPVLLPVLVLLAILTSAISMGIIHVGHPLIHIANRWCRWLLIALLFSLLLHNADWPAGRPLPTLFLVTFLSWFLLETMINWAKISIFSKSDYPLFPRYLPNHDGDEWPVHQSAIDLKDWLKTGGYTKQQSLKFGTEESTTLRATFYQDPSCIQRIQIHFLPPNATGRTMFFSISTLLEDESRITTDNIAMPFAVYVPENWDMLRKPLVLSLSTLQKIHLRRVEQSGKNVIRWELDPVDDLEHQRQKLEKVNLEHGFLHPIDFREEFGRLTAEGRYRMWKEMWLLSYLGKPLSTRPANPS